MTTISKEDQCYLIMFLALRQACKELSVVLKESDDPEIFIKCLEYAFGQYQITSDATRLKLLESRDRIIKETPEFAA